MSESSPTQPLTTEKTFSNYNKNQGKAYAQGRPDYHPKLYQSILDSHTSTGGQLDTLLDVGSGPGNVARALGVHFTHAIGLDPAEAMVETARSLGGTTSTSEPIRFEISNAEDLGTNLFPPIQDNSVDLITAANSAHWFFDMARFWETAARILKPGGSVVIWTNGKTGIHPSVPGAAALEKALDAIEETELKPFIEPGNILTRNLYAGLPLPWTLETPVPEFDKSGFIRKEWDSLESFYAHQPSVDMDTMEKVYATFSPIKRWREAHPDTVGTERDIVKIYRRTMERVLQEAGVEKGKETIKGAMHGVILTVKKRA